MGCRHHSAPCAFPNEVDAALIHELSRPGGQSGQFSMALQGMHAEKRADTVAREVVQGGGSLRGPRAPHWRRVPERPFTPNERQAADRTAAPRLAGRTPSRHNHH